jgi:hypothetical protein
VVRAQAAQWFVRARVLRIGRSGFLSGLAVFCAVFRSTRRPLGARRSAAARVPQYARSTQERLGEAVAHVAVVQVAVGVDGEPHVRVTERLLRDRGAGAADHRGAERVARAVERDVPRDRPRPCRRLPAPGAHLRSGAILRRVPLDPAAVRSAAAVLEPVDHAGARDGGPEHPVQAQLARVHRAIRLREEQGTRGAQRELEARPELLGDGDGHRLAVLRPWRIPGTPDHHDAAIEVDVGLEEPEDLALAQASVEAHRDRAAPRVGDLGEHRLPLVQLEEPARAARDLEALDVDDGVRAPFPGAPRLARDRVEVEEEPAEVVQRLGAERADLVGEQALQPDRRHVAELLTVELGEVLVEERPHHRRAQRLALHLPPPRSELAEGRAERLGGHRLEPVALPARLLLELGDPAPGELLERPRRERLSVEALRLERLLPELAVAVDPLDDATAVLSLEERTHGMPPTGCGAGRGARGRRACTRAPSPG